MLESLKNQGWDGTQVIMDRAYEGDETRQLVFGLGMQPVVPPKRNEVERLFRRLKGFRRIFSRFGKLDVMFMFFIHFALIVDALS